jgi:hypothetical protein
MNQTLLEELCRCEARGPALQQERLAHAGSQDPEITATFDDAQVQQLLAGATAADA